MTSKLYDWDVRSISKINPEMAKKQSFFDFFSKFSKTVHTIRTVFFYTIFWSFVCNFSKFVWFWDWSESEGRRPKLTPSPHMRLCFELQSKSSYTGLQNKLEHWSSRNDAISSAITALESSKHSKTSPTLDNDKES